MRGQQSAFDVLGLRPGADRAEIDRAYRRLIKLYHPDSPGGDGERASEINRAYTHLRKSMVQLPAVAPRPRLGPRPSRGSRTPLAVVLVAAAGGAAWTSGLTENVQWEAGPSYAAIAPAPNREASAVPPPPGVFDAPVSTVLVDRAIDDARRLHEETDVRTMAAASADCQRALRSNPTAFRFDSCAAFDEAAAILQAGRAGFRSGPFNELAVTARQVAGARMVTPDYLAADSRLQQIRSRVQMALMPGIPDPEPVDGGLVGAAAR